MNEWEEFSQAIKIPKEKPGTDQASSFQTPEPLQKIVETINLLQRVPVMHEK